MPTQRRDGGRAGTFEAAGALDLLERERCTSIVGWATVLEQIRAVPGFEDRDVRAFDAFDLPEGDAAAVRLSMLSSRGDPPNIGMTETFGPHANRQWFDYRIVDAETGEQLADGDVGEFCVRGFGLTAGLYKQERKRSSTRTALPHRGPRLPRGRTHLVHGSVRRWSSRAAPTSRRSRWRGILECLRTSGPRSSSASATSGGEAVAAVVVPTVGGSLTPRTRARVNLELSSARSATLESRSTRKTSPGSRAASLTERSAPRPCRGVERRADWRRGAAPASVRRAPRAADQRNVRLRGRSNATHRPPSSSMQSSCARRVWSLAQSSGRAAKMTRIAHQVALKRRPPCRSPSPTTIVSCAGPDRVPPRPPRGRGALQLRGRDEARFRRSGRRSPISAGLGVNIPGGAGRVRGVSGELR